MSLAYAPAVSLRTVPVVRTGVLARDVCSRGGRGTVVAVFERSLYIHVSASPRSATDRRS
jgi:hypothetical protein